MRTSEPETKAKAPRRRRVAAVDDVAPKRSGSQRDLAERLRVAELGRVKAEAAAREAQAEVARLSRLMSAGQFVSWIAHELNQPIAAVVTNGEAALRWLRRETPDLEEAEAAMLRIIRDANRAVSVVNSTRAMLAKEKPDFQLVDLNQVVEDALILTQAEQRRAHVSVLTALTATLPPVRGDRVQLQQVALNLVLNGIDAMKAVEDRPRILSITTDLTAGGQAEVRVEDCGVGIDPANVERLFEHFFTTKAHGIGLGLPISRSIVESHGGRLWASPALGQGAVFQFALPAAGGRKRPAGSRGRH